MFFRVQTPAPRETFREEERKFIHTPTSVLCKFNEQRHTDVQRDFQSAEPKVFKSKSHSSGKCSNTLQSGGGEGGGGQHSSTVKEHSLLY